MGLQIPGKAPLQEMPYWNSYIPELHHDALRIAAHFVNTLSLHLDSRFVTLELLQSSFRLKMRTIFQYFLKMSEMPVHMQEKLKHENSVKFLSPVFSLCLQRNGRQYFLLLASVRVMQYLCCVSPGNAGCLC
jgi:hypothetical protein